jgi:hypothetical protein
MYGVVELYLRTLTSMLDEDEWSVSWSSHFIPQGKNPWCSFDRRLCEPWSHSGHCAEEQYLCLSQESNHNYLTIQPYHCTNWGITLSLCYGVVIKSSGRYTWGECGQSLRSRRSREVMTYTWNLKIQGAFWFPFHGCMHQRGRWLHLDRISSNVHWLFPVGRLAHWNNAHQITITMRHIILR